MKVVVVGGGIGGLGLAQSLHRSGVDVEVHERDAAVGGRWEGYRIHVNPTGARALHACLPARAWREFRETAGPGGDFGFLTEQLDELVVVEESIMYPAGPSDPAEDHYAADRAVLRRLLADGLDDVVRYGAEFVDYDLLPDGRVRARFADGRTTDADLLVGADGVRSRVRRRLLPTVRPRPTGATGIANKIWLTDEVRAALPARLRTGMNVVSTDAPFFLFTSVFEPPRGAGRPYLLCALVARTDALPPDLADLDADALRIMVDVLVAGWHPALRRALAEADPHSRTATAFHSTLPPAPWPAGPVTVLGDAIHAMPPIGGLGGNTALRDAHLLGRLLPAVHRGERDLLPAVAEYEAEMREYGPAAVRYSLEQQDQALAAGAAGAAVTRAFFRLCGAVPPLRRRVFAKSWIGPAMPREWELRPAA
ncbi:FAD-dependent oxidoreductase [Pseudonocardia humida]|uniref:FAD-dependent monooxygenase n=1 Tax=Pseudonocardia humida TaxID=2800819 RepID=A0ABT0ZUH9_9PSEU|nr:FAD-dependent monooxygenase [Pseudonocardia humida]MCO1654386.1 FAD-dependent monooxygenase [Pseudonocardia humida]